MKQAPLFQVRFKQTAKLPKGFHRTTHYNVTQTRQNGKQYRIGQYWFKATDCHKIEVTEPEAKPFLRKIASLKPDEVIECKDIPQLEAVCEQAIKENIEDAESVLSTIKDNLRMPVCISYGRVAKNTLNYGYKYYYEEKGCTVLPASKFVDVSAEAQPEQVEKFEQLKIDRPIESYKAFPEWYVVPKGTRVIKVAPNDEWVKQGSVGVSTETSYQPCIKWKNDDYDLHGSKKNWAQYSHNLAPLDDRDHPEHPEFNGKKEQEKPEQPITPDQTEAIRKADERIKELEKQIQDYEGLTQRMQDDIDSRAGYEERMQRDISGMNEAIERFNKVIAVSQEAVKSENETLHSVVLRSIANGEI